MNINPFLKPPPLKHGDTIGIVAPSLPLFEHDRETFEKAKSVWAEMGFRLLEGETLSQQHRWSAGTPAQIADDINRMFANREVKAIIGHTGGFSAMSVVDRLDYDLIARNPKPFIGLSDITVYQWAMYVQTGLIGFHGNDFTFGFGQQYFADSPEDQKTIMEWYKQMLCSAEPLGPVPFMDECEVWRAGEAEGVLLGGNLKRFMLLAGTRYFPPLETFDHAILFWEEIGETWYDIAIYLEKLKSMGILERLGGMVIGRPVWINSYFDHIEHPTLKELVLEIAADFDLPILYGLKLGHHTSSILLPIGCRASMETAGPILSVLTSAHQS